MVEIFTPARAHSALGSRPVRSVWQSPSQRSLCRGVGCRSHDFPVDAGYRPAVADGLHEMPASRRSASVLVEPPLIGGRRAPTVLRRLVRGLDTGVRRFHGVREFTNQPDCLLQIAVGQAGADVRLAERQRRSPRRPGARPASMERTLDEHTVDQCRSRAGHSTAGRSACRSANSPTTSRRSLHSAPSQRCERVQPWSRRSDTKTASHRQRVWL